MSRQGEQRLAGGRRADDEAIPKEKETEVATNALRSAALAVSILLAVATMALAQVPAQFTNLQVFPPDTGRRELITAMRGFARALNVRCNHCHVGEDPQDLETHDFSSDAKETKKVARAMMEMTREINRALLPKIGRTAPLGVTCTTCHHGLARPQTLVQVLAETLDEGGSEAAAVRYRELREANFGRGTFDFGERALIRFAEELIQQQKIDDAKRVLELNLEFHPGSWTTHFSLGEILRQTGEGTSALEHFVKAAEIEPENRQLQLRVQALRRELQ